MIGHWFKFKQGKKYHFLPRGERLTLCGLFYGRVIISRQKNLLKKNKCVICYRRSLRKGENDVKKDN